MLRLTITLILFFLFFSSCDRDQVESNVALDVIVLHERSSNVSDSTYWYLKRATALIKIADAEVPDSIKAENSYLLGAYYKKEGKLDSALVSFHLATDFVGDSIIRKKQGEYFKEAWAVSMDLEKYGDALVVLERYRAALDEKRFRKLWLNSYYLDVWTYKRMNNYSKALEINKFQETATREFDPENLPILLISRADIKYRFLKDKKGAFRILDSLILNEKDFTFNDKRQVYGKYGVFSYYEGEYKNALKSYLKTISNTKKTKNVSGKIDLLANGYNNLAEVSIDLRQYKNARLYLDSVKLLGLHKLEERHRRSSLNYELRLATETNKDLGRVMNIMDSLYSSQNRLYEDKFNDDLLELTKTSEKQKTLLLEKQAAELNNLKLQSRLILLFAAIGLIITLGYLFFRQRKLKFEKEGLQMQQRLLRSQMNPHFTFNTLYSIQNKIETNPKEGSNHLLKFSRLLRLILENSTSNYILLEKELESLRQYMELQLVRFPSKFTYEVVFDNLEEDDFIFIPPMLLQPFIENSIEHGFEGIDYPGKITIRLSLKKKFIQCSIEDNGKGLSQSQSLLKRSTSMNLISDFLLKATKSEIEIFNKEEQPENNKGLLVKFLIPYKLTEHD